MTRAPSSLVACCCGCGTKVDVVDAVGLNGKWSRVEHFRRALEKICPRPEDVRRVVIEGLEPMKAFRAGKEAGAYLRSKSKEGKRSK